MNQLKLHAFCAEMVQLRVIQPSTSNEFSTYERVQPSKVKPVYDKVELDRRRASKPVQDYAYACVVIPKGQKSQRSSAAGGVSRLPSREEVRDDDSGGRLMSLSQSHEALSKQFPRRSTLSDDVSDAQHPVPPVRPRNQVGRECSRRKLPPPPPDEYAHYDYIVPEPRPDVGNPTSGHPASTVVDLSVEDVAACLRRLHLDAFVDAFRRQGVDGALLSSIDEQMLISDIGMSRFEAKKLMMFVKQGWRPKNAANN